MKKLPLIGERVKFEDRNPSKESIRILEGTVTEVTTKFGGMVYLTNITSEDEFIVRLECLL